LKLIDTNVVIYAMGSQHPYKDICRRALSLVFEQKVEANIDVETLQEIAHFYHRRNRLDFGLSLFDRLLLLFPSPLPITHELAVVMRELLARYPHLQARDAIHAAVVLQHGLEGIISADRGFDAVPEISRFDPKDL